MAKTGEQASFGTAAVLKLGGLRSVTGPPGMDMGVTDQMSRVTGDLQTRINKST